jgi:homoserine kinase
MRTADARAALPLTVSRDVAIHQMAQVAAMVAALYSGDLALLGRALEDRIAEPARAPLLPGFLAAKRAALEAGALGASISGSGPTAFALANGQTAAERIGFAMAAAYAAAGIRCVIRTGAVDTEGARVVSGPGAFA